MRKEAGAKSKVKGWLSLLSFLSFLSFPLLFETFFAIFLGYIFFHGRGGGGGQGLVFILGAFINHFGLPICLYYRCIY